MEWIQLLTIFGANLLVFIWARNESRNDQSEMIMLMKSIQDEMKDFHDRLLEIDEKIKDEK